jgi:hypothetical protein
LTPRQRRCFIGSKHTDSVIGQGVQFINHPIISYVSWDCPTSPAVHFAIFYSFIFPVTFLIHLFLCQGIVLVLVNETSAGFRYEFMQYRSIRNLELFLLLRLHFFALLAKSARLEMCALGVHILQTHSHTPLTLCCCKATAQRNNFDSLNTSDIENVPDENFRSYCVPYDT